jgi:hypothetical protein
MRTSRGEGNKGETEKPYSNFLTDTGATVPRNSFALQIQRRLLEWSSGQVPRKAHPTPNHRKWRKHIIDNHYARKNRPALGARGKSLTVRGAVW